MTEHVGRIARDLMGEPHIAGHRISVRRVRALVEGGDRDPRAVADSLGADLAEVYRAPAYYHDNPGEMHEIERRRERRIEAAGDRGGPTGPENL